MSRPRELQQSYGRLSLYINGQWVESASQSLHPVYDPAKGEVIGEVPFATGEEIDLSVTTAAEAFQKWRELPLPDRVQYLYRMKESFERHYEDLAIINTQNHGKTIHESRGDVRRTIENIEAAISAAYTLTKGDHMDLIASGIDASALKEPLGVFGIICPFNFPLMIPFWFIPYAIAVGCTLVVKPSEITPLPMDYVMKIFEKEVKLPAGVLNMVHGGKETVEKIVSDKTIQGITFVGSTPVAKQLYRLAGEHGKRAISNGGAKNSIVVMPDAEVDKHLQTIISSFFGNTGQRCLAGANLLGVGEIKDGLVSKFVEASKLIRLGPGLEDGTDMGPLVTDKARGRVIQYTERGLSEGAHVLLDGRGANVVGSEGGFFLGPTVLDGVTPDMTIAKEEVFGPLTSVLHTNDLDEAIEIINGNTNFGNMACIFTTNGRTAREFRRRVEAGNIGINLGVAAPIAFFPFGGRRDSFYGVLHPQIDTIDFFTDRKFIVSRW